MAAPDGFHDFVADRYHALVRSAYLLVSNPSDAEDLVQDALARCVPAWHRIEGSPEAYVRRVMVRQNISRWRRTKGREITVETVPDTAVRDRDVTQRDELRAALSQLPARQRTAVVLRHVEDRSEAQTAELMGCTVGTVKSQTHAGLARLRTILDDSARVEATTSGT